MNELICEKSNNSITNMNVNHNYDDISLDDTLNNMGLSEATIINYTSVMMNFLKCNDITFNELIKTIGNLQDDIIEDNRIIRYDPNYSLIKQYYDNFINMGRNKNKKESTIKSNIRIINSILKQKGIKTPNIKFTIKNTQKKTPVLTSNDIKYIINNHCNIHQKAIITFMASTGIRRFDTLDFKINDYLEATYNYHETLDLDEFMETYHNNMVGYWEFTPHKTIKSGLVCKTCNSGESSNYIIESLKARLIAIEKYNKLHDTDIKLTVDDALFSNKNQHYIGHITENGLSNVIGEKNRIFKKYKIRTIKEDLKNKKITMPEYKKLKDNIPIFKLHNLRHYFISTLRRHGINRDVSLIMEAHTSDIATDKYYIGESEELFNEEYIRETYNKVEKYLTFNNNVSLEKTEQLENDYNKLLEENKELKNLIDEIEPMKETLNKLFEIEPMRKLFEKRSKSYD